jgi:isoleucyl-tRNA synthetase
MEAEVIAAYDKSEFHVVYQKISQFVAVELSSIYHDVIKDRLYTDPANSKRRRSTQTALHKLVTGLCQMLSPILAYTADEAWEFVPGKNVHSVHESEFRPLNFPISEVEMAKWNILFVLREIALGELENARRAKRIGKALDAKIVWAGTFANLKMAKQHIDEFKELLNVSQLEIDLISQNLPSEYSSMAGTIMSESSRLIAVPAAGQKCERCWHWEADIGQNTEHPTICGRCVEAVLQFKTS